MPHAFNYDDAFDRNIGWVTEAEQASLRGRTVAIAGMGGVGGIHLLTLVRLGIGGVRIADFDTFSIANFNRQAGATMATIGRPKLDVMAEMALDINPELRIARFPHGVQPGDVDSFLEGADLFVDGFDFFELAIRRQVFARAAELGIPAVTAAPIGLGTGYLAFVPGGMTFEQYFRLDGQPEEEQFLRFLMGVVPRAGCTAPTSSTPAASTCSNAAGRPPPRPASSAPGSSARSRCNCCCTAPACAPRLGTSTSTPSAANWP